MRLAVISDIHGNLTALDAVLADLAGVGEVDRVWHLGDYAAFGGRPSECIQRVRQQQADLGEDRVRVIGGNTDRYLVTGERFPQPPAKDEESFSKLARIRSNADIALNWNLERINWSDYEWLAGVIGKEADLHVKGYGHVIGYHAVPGDDEAMLRPDTPEEQAADYLLDREGRLAIGGHTHIQMDREIGDWRVLNVGSVGMSFEKPGMAQWGLLTFSDDGEVSVDLRNIPYDVDAMIADLRQVDYPNVEWAIKRLGLNQ
ncbi:MAG: metallophosphoesterase family protein [Chloroflexota bacterium]